MNFRLIFSTALFLVWVSRLAQSEHPLLGSDAAALDHDEVLLHLTIVGESSHRVDGLVCQVVLCCGVVLDKLSVLHFEALAHPVYLLIDFSPMVITLLTSP